MCLSIPAKLLSITGDDPNNKMGKVSFGGILKEISLAYVPDARLGNYVLIHVGFAISIVDEEEAQFVFNYLSTQDEIQ